MATHTAAPAVTHPAATQAKPAAAAIPAKPAVAAAKPAPAPTTAAPAPPAVPQYSSFNRTTVVLDPAHGGQDNGSRLTDSLVEKDIALAFAFKLRSLLQARGFAVVLTRDSDAATEASDPSTPLTLDDRAGTANHARAAACLLIHATGAGTGVHLYHSELDPTPGEQPAAPWLTAQSAWVSQSTELSQKLSQSITRSSIPLVASAASVRPVDSLTCPALVVEIAPRDSGDASTASDSDYQQKIAEAIANALVFWRNQAQPPKLLSASTPTTGGKP